MRTWVAEEGAVLLCPSPLVKVGRPSQLRDSGFF
jgi:hypothetical protein